MSAGQFVSAIYQTNGGAFYAIQVQPETLNFTLNSVANAAPTGTPGIDTPSVSVSGSRRKNGINSRLVRFRFTGTLPPGYFMGGTLTLPVLSPTVFNGYSRGQAGTYTLNGTEYAVEFVGKTAESIR